MFKIGDEERKRVSLSNTFNFSAAAGLAVGVSTGLATLAATAGAFGPSLAVGAALGGAFAFVSLFGGAVLRMSAAPMNQGFLQDEMFKASAWRGIRFNKNASAWGAGTGLAVIVTALGMSLAEPALVASAPAQTVSIPANDRAPV